MICAGVVIASGIFLCMEKIYRPALEWLNKIPLLSGASNRILGILLTGRELMKPKVFITGLVVSTVSWGMESLSMYLILQGFDLSATFLQANFVYCFSTLIGALSMLPGGIGGTEAGMIGLLGFIGVSYIDGLPAVILIRVFTLWFAIAVGLSFAIYMLAKEKKIRIA